MKTKKILSFLLVFSILASLLLGVSLPVSAASGNWTDFCSPAAPALDTTTQTYTISNAEELAWIAVQVNANNNSFSGYTFEISAPIDLKDHYWVPISTGVPFQGNFDGNGNAISNMTISDSSLKYTGLFGLAVNGSISGVNLTNVAINTTYSADFGYAGGLVGYASGETITNCSVSGSIAFAASNANAYCGGLAGRLDNGTLTGCAVLGTVTANLTYGLETYCGGFAGDVQNGSISNSSSSVVVTGSAQYFGGFAGRLYRPTVTGSSTAGSCENNDSSVYAPYIGGFAGFVSSSTINGCRSSAGITRNSTSGTVGGFVGYGDGGTFTGCCSTGNLTGGGETGGFVGSVSTSLITGSYSTGTVSSNGTSVGGFAGYNDAPLSGCYAGGAVTSSSGTSTGGFAGHMTSAGSAINCYAKGNVSGPYHVGGFSGYNNGSITNCYSIGTAGGSGTVGAFSGTNGNSITNCYWLTGAAAYGIGSNTSDETSAVVKTSAELSDALFYVTLNNGQTSAPWKQIAGVNSGYPVLDGIGEGAAAVAYTVSGTVTSAASGVSAAGLTVGLYSSDATDYSGVPLYNSTTASDGSYSIAGVAAGSYVAVVAADAAGTYAESKSASFTVSADTGANNIKLMIICTINGTVTLPDSTTPAPDDPVKMYGYDWDSNSLYYLSSTTTDAVGHFTFSVSVADSGFYYICASTYESGDTAYTANAAQVIVSPSSYGTTYTADISLVDLSDSWLGHVMTPAGYTEGDTTITITTPEELAWLALQSALFQNGFSGVTINLEADLDLSGYNWAPICPYQGFGGVFNGNGHVISNLNADVYCDTANYSIYTKTGAGLFSDIDGGTVKDLGLTDVYVALSANITSFTELGAGALSAHAANAVISGCYSTGNVSSTVMGSFVGGLIGQAYDSSISQCYSKCNVSNNSNSSTYGYGGGLLGHLGHDNSADMTATVIDCYATGSVIGSCKWNGGLFGCYIGAVTIANAYAAGTVGGAAYNGSFAGYGQCNGSISNIYWLDQGVVGIADGAAADMAISNGLTGDQMTAQTFADLLNSDSDTTDPWLWYPGVNNGYPVLDNIGEGVPPVTTHTLTIYYIYADSTTAATTHTETVDVNSTYNVTSPEIPRYTADQTVVSGTMTDADVTVTVTYIRIPSVVTSIEISGADTVIIYPRSSTLSAYSAKVYDQFGEEMIGQTVTWSLSAPVSGVSINASTGVLKVTSRAPAGGTVTVKAVCESASDTCTVTLKRYVPVSYVRLYPSSLKLQPGETAMLTATVYPSNATNQAVTWSSGNPAVATVVNGIVTAIGYGTVTITVRSADGGRTASCRVTIAVSVTGVTLNTTSASLKLRDTLQLTATITPANATNQNVTWKSSNNRVARVDSNGKVTAVGRGTATITVITNDGNYSGACTIRVR
ncbi:MAG: Ig-like domain-containing protein [Clostridiaceae bacterium]|nr:Ig-like domain-containing protein [Clostridiaceae bacterium]